MGGLRQFRLLLATGDRACGAEEGGALADLVLGLQEELVQGLGGGGVFEADVDGEVEPDVVVCSLWRWDGLVLKLD